MAELSAALGLTVTGVKRATVHTDGEPWPDPPNSFALRMPDVGRGGWAFPVKTDVLRSRPRLQTWARQRGSTVQFNASDGRRVLALLHRCADEQEESE